MSGEGTDLSPPQSRPTRGVVRARFEDKQDKVLDDAMGRGETWAKKVRNSQQGILLDDVPTLLAVLGLKVVDSTRICITPAELAEYEACKTLARAHLTPPGPQLEQDFDK